MTCIGSQRFHHFYIRGTAYPGHFRPEVLGKLYRISTDTTGSAIRSELFVRSGYFLFSEYAMLSCPQQEPRRPPHRSYWTVLMPALLSTFFRQAYVLGISTNTQTGSRSKNPVTFLNRFTSLPTASISPANSCPGMFFLVVPNSRNGRNNNGWNFRSITSPVVTVAAYTLISTSLSLGVGFSPLRDEEHLVVHILCIQSLS